LSETKIFTASSVSSAPPPSESVTITAGQRIDLAVLLGKSPSSLETEATTTQSSSVSQPLVFSNSKQSSMSQAAPSGSFTHHSMVSMLSKGFGDGEPKGGTTSGSQFLEQFKTAQALAQLAAQHSESSSSTSWDLASSAAQTTSLGQYDLKSSSDPFNKPQQSFSPVSTMMDVYLQEKVPVTSAPSSPLTSKTNHPTQMSPVSPENQSGSPQPAHQKMKAQKKKTSLTSKIPALAVEMPGTADISGLNLQFGALQFGSEPVLPEYESSPAPNAVVSQSQSSLYTSPASESSSSVVSQSPESAYQASSIQSATFTSQSSTQGPLYEQRSTQTRRYPISSSTSSPQKDISQSKNGYSSTQTSTMQTPVSGEVLSAPAIKADPVSAPGMAPLSDSLLTTAGPHSSQLSSLSHSEELQNPGVSAQLSSTLSSQHQTPVSSAVRTSSSTPLVSFGVF
ncbi:hypothetical protein GDO81_023040, partial [Engystomops pustulosus]